MRLTVLGGCGAWPAGGQACSGYLVEHDGFRLLPHSVPNAGVRLVAGGRVLAYTGGTGPSPAIVELARGADLFLAEAQSVAPTWRRVARPPRT